MSYGDRIPVSSSNLQAIRYDAERQLLEVEFATGTYEYSGVSQTVVDQLLAAPSAGKFVHQRIKDVYDVRKVG